MYLLVKRLDVEMVEVAKGGVLHECEVLPFGKLDKVAADENVGAEYEEWENAKGSAISVSECEGSKVVELHRLRLNSVRMKESSRNVQVRHIGSTCEHPEHVGNG